MGEPQPAGELKGHGSWISAVALSPDGKTLAVANSGRGAKGQPDLKPHVKIWDVAGRKAQSLVVLRIGNRHGSG